MKRILAILLSALILLTMVPMVSADDIYNDDQFDWDEDTCPHTETRAVEAVPSTCETQGHGAYTYCVGCGLVLEGSNEPLPLEHVYLYACDQWCNHCGEKTNPRAKHHILHAEAKEAVSCVEFGNIEYWYCEYCNGVWKDAAGRYQSNMMSVKIYGPCVSNAAFPCQDGECVNCGLPYAADEAHTYDGVCDATCNVCGDSREAQEHTYDTVVVHPDCVNGGYTSHTCSGCGDTYTTDATDALGHSYVPLSAEPATCGKDGFEKYYCPTCGDSYTVTIPALNHSYTVETTPADCATKTDGKNVYTCSVCGDSYEETIPFEHVYLYACDQWCNNCGEKTNPRAKHHILHAEAKEAVSCVEFGNIEYWYCEYCNGVWKDAAGRYQSNMMSVKIYGPCVSNAAFPCQDGECVNCGLPYAADEAHTYDHACDANCNVCGDSREVEDHVYDDDADPDCNVCGAKRDGVLAGDINGDGKLNNRDLGVLQMHLNELSLGNQTFDEAAADINGDGKINNRDLGMLQILLNA